MTTTPLSGATTRSQAAANGSRRRKSDEVGQELPGFCALPSCRSQFIRTIGPGRPQLFCSDLCRRAYERELRKARARLAHFEEVVTQCRADLATYLVGREDEDEAPGGQLMAEQSAAAAVQRVAGVLAFLGDNNDPVAQELRNLHEAVAPFHLIS